MSDTGRTGRASPERVLAFIRQFSAEHDGRSPQVKEIAAHFRISSPGVEKHLKTLEQQGKLMRVRERGLGFSIFLLPEAGTLNTVSAPIPLRGYFTKQGLIHSFSEPLALKHVLETVQVLDARNAFALLAGEDNPDYYIQRGDLLVFERNRAPRPTQLVALESEGRLTVLMYYFVVAGVSPREVEPAQALAMESIAPVPLGNLGEYQGSTGLFVSLADPGEEFSALRTFLDQQRQTEGRLRIGGTAIKLTRGRLQLAVVEQTGRPAHPILKQPEDFTA
jgi:SOS-response transcriptional repressor LexA